MDNDAPEHTLGRSAAIVHGIALAALSVALFCYGIVDWKVREDEQFPYVLMCVSEAAFAGIALWSIVLGIRSALKNEGSVWATSVLALAAVEILSAMALLL